MKTVKPFIVLFFAVMACFSSLAQVAFITKTSAKKIGKNETLEVTYEAQEGDIQNFNEPRFPGWHLVSGPNLSSSTIITNGKRTSSTSYQFVLRPEQTGRLTIPGAKATIDGKTYASHETTVEVTNQDVVNDNSTGNSNTFDPFQVLTPDMLSPEEAYDNSDAYLLQQGEDPAKKTKNNLFAVVDVSKKTCYPGEAIKATYKLYSRVNMDAHLSKRPSFNGFSSIDLPDGTNGEPVIETRKGKMYKVYPIRTVQLYPLQAGTQTLEPVEIDATIQYRKADPASLQSDPLGTSSIINYPYVVKSEPVQVTVLPFPENNKPADFNGVTGDFTITSSTDYKDLAKKESGNFVVTISGNGNWAMLQTPQINWPAGVDVFEPVISEKLDSQAVPISGKRTYEFPFTCNNAGTLIIPPVTLSYFDAARKQYQTISSNPINVAIKQSEKPLHKTTSVINTIESTDGTEIFTGIVKIIFPVAAVLLAGWFLISYKNRKRSKRQQARFIDEYESSIKKTTNSFNNGYQDMLAVNKESFNEITSSNFYDGNTTPLAEKENELNEHAGFLPLTAKEYFTSVKTRLLQLLRASFNIIDQPVYITKQALLQQGIPEQDADKITGMLQLCEKHIYSPFTETFDQRECDALLSEITTIISNRKN